MQNDPTRWRDPTGKQTTKEDLERKWKAEIAQNLRRLRELVGQVDQQTGEKVLKKLEDFAKRARKAQANGLRDINNELKSQVESLEMYIKNTELIKKIKKRVNECEDLKKKLEEAVQRILTEVEKTRSLPRTSAKTSRSRLPRGHEDRSLVRLLRDQDVHRSSIRGRPGARESDHSHAERSR